MTPEERIRARMAQQAQPQNGNAQPAAQPQALGHTAQSIFPAWQFWHNPDFQRWMRERGPDLIQGAAAGALNAVDNTVDDVGANITAGADRYQQVLRQAQTGNLGAAAEMGALNANPASPFSGRTALALRDTLVRWGVMNREDGDMFPDARPWVQTPDSMEGSLAEGFTRFTVGFLGAGRVLRGARLLQGGGRGLNIVRGMAQGAIADHAVWDGHEARLSNLLRDHAGLRDPVTAYLAADPTDSEAEGRFKTTLEGLGFGAIMETIFAGARAIKINRLFRNNRATPAELDAASRAVYEAAQADAARIEQEAQASARRFRVDAINARFEEDLKRLDELTFGQANLASNPYRQSVAPSGVEAADLASGRADPTSLTARQEAALANYQVEKAAIEQRRLEALKLEDLRAASERGDTDAVLNGVQEINAARTVQVGGEGVTQRAGPVGQTPERQPIKVLFGRGGDEAIVGNEIVQDRLGNTFNRSDFTAHFDSDGNVRLMPKTPEAAQAIEAATPMERTRADLAQAAQNLRTTDGTDNAYRKNIYETFGRAQESPHGTPNWQSHGARIGEARQLGDETVYPLLKPNGTEAGSIGIRQDAQAIYIESLLGGERAGIKGQATNAVRAVIDHGIQTNRTIIATNTKDAAEFWQKLGFRAEGDNHVFDTRQAEARNYKPARAIEPTRQLVSIAPDKQVTILDVMREARKQAARMRNEANVAAHGVDVRDGLTAEADVIDKLATELMDNVVQRGPEAANRTAAKIAAHFDDQAREALYRKRGPSEADRLLGQTDNEVRQRALGNRAPQAVLVDEDLVKGVARHYAGSPDVAAVSIRQLNDAWRAGDPRRHASNVNLEHIQGEDQVLQFMNVFADMTEAATRSIRGETLAEGSTATIRIGVRTQEQTERVARALAKDFGTDAATLVEHIKSIAGGTDSLAEKLTALRMLHYASATEAQRLMEVYIRTNSEHDLNRALHALQAFGVVHGTVKGSTSETARALASLRMKVRSDAGLVEQFSSIVDESVVRSLDPQGKARNALEALQRLGGQVADATSLRGIARIFEPKWHRAIEDYFTANILSAPSTHILNILSNAQVLISTPAERMLAGAVKRDGALVRQAVDHVTGMLAVSGEAWRLAGRAFREGRTFLDSTFAEEFRSNFRAEAFGLDPDKFFGRGLNALGKAVGVVNRLLGAQDEFFKQLTYRTELYSTGIREARAAGYRGSDLAAFVDEFVTKGFTGEGRSIRAGVRPEEMNLRQNAYDRALQLSRRNTFTEDPGKLIGGFERAIRAIPLGRLVLPFFRTPMSIVKYWARRTGIAVPTPWGWKGLGLSRSFMEDVTGRNGRHMQEQAIGQVMLGKVLYGSAAMLALNGMITGYGPSDPAVRQQLMANGWRPYSFKFGDTYVPYGRADPFGMFFGVVADIHDLASDTYHGRPDDPLEIPSLVVLHLAQMLREKTFFQGIDSALSLFERQPQGRELDNLARFSGNITSGLVPASGALNRLTDDGYMHRPRQMLDTVMARSPFRSGVEYRRNWLGERIRGDQAMLAHPFVSPYTMSHAADDRALNEIAAVALTANGGMSEVERTINGVQLTAFQSPVTQRNAYDRLQELMSETRLNGRTLREAIEDTIDSPRYQNGLTDGSLDGDLRARGSRQTELSRIRNRYLDVAERELRREIPELDTELRRAEALQRNRRRAGEFNQRDLPAGLEWLDQ